MANKTKVKAKKKAVKKKSTAKKKKTSKKKKRKRRTTDMALTKYTLTPSPIAKKQLLFILQRTPKQHIYQRKAKGGGTWDYVTGVYVKKVLNYCFSWLWNEEVVNSGLVTVGNKIIQIWVDVKLTINRINPKTKQIEAMIIKTQTGRADVKYLKSDPKTPMDFGNDRKAAITDGLKKCASELGIANDVYGKSEFQAIQKQDKGFTPPKVEVVEPKPEPNIEPIVEAEVVGQKVDKLKKMLKGSTDAEKVEDLKAKTSIKLSNGFNITEKHAGILIVSLLGSEVKN